MTAKRPVVSDCNWPLCTAVHNGHYEKTSIMTRPWKASTQDTSSAAGPWHSCTSHNLGLQRSAVRREAIRAHPTTQTPAASLPSEVELCIGVHHRPELAKVMHAGPLRDDKFMASEGCL